MRVPGVVLGVAAGALAGVGLSYGLGWFGAPT